LLLGIASAVFLGLSPVGLMSIIFLSFIERDKEKRKLGVVVEDTTLVGGVEKQCLLFRRFPGSTC
jgi:hypothetical protein